MEPESLAIGGDLAGQILEDVEVQNDVTGQPLFSNEVWLFDHADVGDFYVVTTSFVWMHPPADLRPV